MTARAIGARLMAAACFGFTLTWAWIAGAVASTPGALAAGAIALAALVLLRAWLADLDRERWAGEIVRGAEEHLARAGGPDQDQHDTRGGQA